MRLKTIVAREWLIFVLFFFLSPAVLAVYKWMGAPPVISSALKGETAEERLENAPDNLLYDLVPVDKKPDPRHEMVLLQYEKRSLWAYFTDSVKKPGRYLAIIFTYPPFLLLRSILWSLRTVRRKEA